MAGRWRFLAALLLGSTMLARPPREARAADPDPVLLAAEASAAYKRGEFQRAIDGYERAYALRPEPTLLFNLGRCYEALATPEALRQAVDKYKAYLAAVGAAPDREAVARRIEALERQVDLIEAAQKPPPAAPAGPRAPTGAQRDEPRRDDGGPSAAPWIVVGVGASGLALGGIFGALALSRHDAAVDEPEGRRATEIQDEAETWVTVSNVAFAAGGVVALAGVIWGIADVVSSRRAPATASRCPRGCPPASPRTPAYRLDVDLVRRSLALRVDL